jgi:hypothetical protein
MLLDIGLFVRVPTVLLAKAKAGQDGVEYRPRAAVETDQEKEKCAQDRADDNTRDRAST